MTSEELQAIYDKLHENLAEEYSTTPYVICVIRSVKKSKDEMIELFVNKYYLSRHWKGRTKYKDPEQPRRRSNRKHYGEIIDFLLKIKDEDFDRIKTYYKDF